MDKKKGVIAYFSLEMGLASDLKTYAGGLGVLTGDMLRSAADTGFPLVGLTLLNRRGYLKQVITAAGEQLSRPEKNKPSRHLEKLARTVRVKIGPDTVRVGVWRYLVPGVSGGTASVYLLDTDLPANSRADRRLTDRLYDSNREHRLKQEIILGRGGVKMLAALGYTDVKKYHINEGHGSLVPIELLARSKRKTLAAKIRAVRSHCVFTVHTPLASAQDIFPLPFLLHYQPDFPVAIEKLVAGHKVNFTELGLYFASYANAVSRRHQLVSRKIFPAYKIGCVTNGVNSSFWTAPEFKKLFDRRFLNWETKGRFLAGATAIPTGEIWAAHQAAKGRLLEYVRKKSGEVLSENVFTIGFARRFAPYKRPEFLFSDSKALRKAERSGKMQIILAGKAHPSDAEGQRLISLIWQYKKKLAGRIRVVFLSDYDMDQAALLTAGVDLWLNTPRLPLEASGTSGMKAAHNGVPQLSTADGWWPEGYVRGRTGWTIRENGGNGKSNIYTLLGKEILPLYYGSPEKWRRIMRSTIARNAPIFNTGRVLDQYDRQAYKLKRSRSGK